MPKTASLYIRIDPQLKADVESVYSRYGMSVTDAINIFLNESRNVGGLPFDLRPRTPNETTLAAMEEVENMIGGKIPKRSMSVDDFVREMGG